MILFFIPKYSFAIFTIHLPENIVHPSKRTVHLLCDCLKLCPAIPLYANY